MKIKLDFITNSSSSGFILSLRKENRDAFEEYMDNLNHHSDAGNEGVRIYMIADSVERLNKYTDERAIDWITRATAVQYDNLSEANYKTCKEIIEEGGVAVECWVDYNVCEKFDEDYGSNIIESFC